MTDDTFTCAICGNTFPKIRNDEEAWKEADENFPGLPPDTEFAVVCDDCFKKVMPGK